MTLFIPDDDVIITWAWRSTKAGEGCLYLTEILKYRLFITDRYSIK